MEDDVDWDIRIRQNLQRFALASRFLSSEDPSIDLTQNPDIEYKPNTETSENSFKILTEHTTVEQTLPWEYANVTHLNNTDISPSPAGIGDNGGATIDSGNTRRGGN